MESTKEPFFIIWFMAGNCPSLRLVWESNIWTFHHCRSRSLYRRYTVLYSGSSQHRMHTVRSDVLGCKIYWLLGS